MTPLLVMIAKLLVTVRTHMNPHLDELAALWAAMRFATQEWLTQYGRTVAGRPTLEFGTGHGQFDEHAAPTKKQSRKHGETTFSLVLTSLGLADHPLLQRMKSYAVAHDLRGRGSRHDLGVFLKTWMYVREYQGASNCDRRVAEWTFTALDAWFYGELLRKSGQTLSPGLTRALESPERLSSLVLLVRAHLGDGPQAKAWEHTMRRVRVEARRVYDAALAELESAISFSISGGSRTVKAILVRSTNPFTLRAKSAVGCDVLIQVRPTGHVMIAAAKSSGIDLAWTASLVRCQLYRAKAWRTRSIKIDNIPAEHRLRYEGSLPGTEELHYHRPGNQLLNGSTSNWSVAPLLAPDGPITVTELVDAVVAGVQRTLDQVPLKQSKSMAA